MQEIRGDGEWSKIDKPEGAPQYEVIVDKFADKWKNTGPKTLQRIWESSGGDTDKVGLEVAKHELLSDELLRSEKPLEEFLDNFDKYSDLLTFLADGTQSPFGRFVRSNLPLIGLYTRASDNPLSTQDYSSLFDKAVIRMSENLRNLKFESKEVTPEVTRGFIISALSLDVSKGGSEAERKEWKGINPFIHNVASAELIRRNGTLEDGALGEFFAKIVEYHGYIGQISRGEVTESVLTGLTDWLKENKDRLGFDNFAEFAGEIYYKINVLDTKSVRDGLFTEKLNSEFMKIRGKMEKVLKGEAEWKSEKIEDVNKKREVLADRLTRLRGGKDSEEVLGTLLGLENEKINYIYDLFDNAQLWYVENATAHFSVENQLKLLTLVSRIAKDKGVDKYGNFDVNFGPLVNTLRPERKLNKALARIIDTSLFKLSWDELLNSPNKEGFKINEHLIININGENGITGADCVLDSDMLNACNLINANYEGKRETSSDFITAVNSLSSWTGIKLDAWDRVFDQEVYIANMGVKSPEKIKVVSEGVDNIRKEGRPFTYVGIGAGSADVEKQLALTLRKGDIVIAMDASYAMYESAKRRVRSVDAERYLHPEKEFAEMRALLLDATNLKPQDLGVDYENTSVLFGFQSVLHELPDEVRDAIFNKVMSNLKIGDGITVRDFMQSEDPDEKNFLVLGEAGEGEIDPAEFILERFNKEYKYLTPTQQTEIDSWKSLAPGSRVEISNGLAMELMGKYSWMKTGGSLNEINEQYGHFNPKGFTKWVKDMAESLGIEIEIKMEVEPGEYEKFLHGKMDLQDAKGNPLPVPLWMGTFNIKRIK